MDAGCPSLDGKRGYEALEQWLACPAGLVSEARAKLEKLDGSDPGLKDTLCEYLDAISDDIIDNHTTETSEIMRGKWLTTYVCKYPALGFGYSMEKEVYYLNKYGERVSQERRPGILYPYVRGWIRNLFFDTVVVPDHFYYNRSEYGER